MAVFVSKLAINPTLVGTFLSSIIFILIVYALLRGGTSRLDAHYSSYNLFEDSSIWTGKIEAQKNEESPLNCSYLTKSVEAAIKTFVFFFGFNHCGSTITGSIIDAHPNALIANEAQLIIGLSTGKFSMDIIPFTACNKSFHFAKGNLTSKKGYRVNTGHLNGRYYSPLTAIGERRSFDTLNFFIEQPGNFSKSYERLESKYRMVGIMVVRNLYDLIATKAAAEAGHVMYSGGVYEGHPVNVTRTNVSKVPGGRKDHFYDFCHHAMANGSAKVVDRRAIHWAIDVNREHAQASARLKKEFNFEYVRVSLESLIENPRDVIHQLCKVVELDCYPGYVDEVAKSLYTKPNPTRNGIDWSPSYIEKVQRIYDDYPEIFEAPIL